MRFSAFIGEGIRPGKEIVEEREIRVIHVLRHFCQRILQILIGLEVICFGGLHDAVNGSACLGTFYLVNHMPVGTSDAERADRSFAG